MLNYSRKVNAWATDYGNREAFRYNGERDGII